MPLLSLHRPYCSLDATVWLTPWLSLIMPEAERAWGSTSLRRLAEYYFSTTWSHKTSSLKTKVSRGGQLRSAQASVGC